MMSSKAHANDWMQYARLFKKDHHEIWKKSGLVEQEGNFLLPMASNELDQLGNGMGKSLQKCKERQGNR